MTTTTTTTTTDDAPIYMVTMSAGTNIACIKYWGKDDVVYNTPINDSISVTLDQNDLRAVTTVAASTKFTSDRLWLNGIEDINAVTNKRFRSCIDGIKALATTHSATSNGDTVTKEEWQKMYIHVSSYNTFPTAAGLASSAAGYAALVASLAELMQAKEEYDGQLTTIARQGSGSACRSLYGGFVAWKKGTPPNWLDSKAIQIQNENYWSEIRALILVVSDIKKDTSSTIGMSTSINTSELIQYRAKHIVPKRMENIIQAWNDKNFNTFGKLTMQDSNQFHSICLDTYPPIFYMNDISRSIIQIITTYNNFYDSIRGAYTFDAGPNAVLYCLHEHVIEIGALILHYYPECGGEKFLNNDEYYKDIQNYKLNPELINACDKTGRIPKSGDVKMIYYTKSGPGPLKVTDHTNLDPKTGLNIYNNKPAE